MKTKIKLLLLLILLISINQKSFSEAEKKDGVISMDITPNDSTYVVTATIKDSKTNAPIGDVEMTLYITRMYGDIKVGTAKTDDAGSLSMFFSAKTPGSDTLGNIFVIAKVEDNDVINDVMVKKVVKAKTTFPAHTPIPAGMITSIAPTWLIITFWSIVIGVWGLFCYVVYLIFLISRDKSKA